MRRWVSIGIGISKNDVCVRVVFPKQFREICVGFGTTREEHRLAAPCGSVSRKCSSLTPQFCCCCNQDKSKQKISKKTDQKRQLPKTKPISRTKIPRINRKPKQANEVGNQLTGKIKKQEILERRLFSPLHKSPNQKYN